MTLPTAGPAGISLWPLNAATRTVSAWTRTTCRTCAHALVDARRARAQLTAVSAALYRAEDDRARQRREIGHLEARIAELLHQLAEQQQQKTVSVLCADDRHTACGGCPGCLCHTTPSLRAVAAGA